MQNSSASCIGAGLLGGGSLLAAVLGGAVATATMPTLRNSSVAEEERSGGFLLGGGRAGCCIEVDAATATFLNSSSRGLAALSSPSFSVLLLTTGLRGLAAGGSTKTSTLPLWSDFSSSKVNSCGGGCCGGIGSCLSLRSPSLLLPFTIILGEVLANSSSVGEVEDSRTPKVLRARLRDVSSLVLSRVDIAPRRTILCASPLLSPSSPPRGCNR